MKYISAVVQQLKKEREHIPQQLQRIDQALAALGSSSSDGTSHTMSAAGRRRISLAQKQRWAKHKAQAHAPKTKRTMSVAARKEDRGGAAGKVGEGEEGGVNRRSRC